MHTYISDITKSYLEVGNYYTVDVIWLNVDPLSIFVPSTKSKYQVFGIPDFKKAIMDFYRPHKQSGQISLDF